MNADIKNTTDQPVMVFHTWLQPNECRVMSLEAAKEAAKIAGIEIVSPPEIDVATDAEEERGWLELQEIGLEEIWADDPLAPLAENSADNASYQQENEPAPAPPTPLAKPPAAKKPAGKKQTATGKRAPK